jgi:catechol 2,3-dioxygenase-like lactoylglutathione lyase family enzyme
LSNSAASAVVPNYIAAGIFQTATVTTDLQRSLDFVEQTLGGGPFQVFESAALEDRTYRGQPTDNIEDLAFGYVGHIQFEIIRPHLDAGESTYTEFLRDQPAGGLHHVGAQVSDIDHAIADLNARGLEVVQTGRFGDNPGTRFAYVDARHLTGWFLEVLQLDSAAAEMFAGLRKSSPSAAGTV